ncbi:FAD dependent oxidoreductase [Desulfotomaculum arcticum]|uniref:FAD dependent oxidoreductase n=2 Tax=Desulfotruncus TaxID=2867377 RepID=A0A1I2X0H4_9FIRM|nr:FAD dependent oxidoreductase [Desulfotomaculum arcticum] [Desulfotruncus arcticus DSM 17038]
MFIKMRKSSIPKSGKLFLILALIAILTISTKPANDDLPPPYKVGDVYDLIVVGSDPEGIAAAVSAARNGLSVLLVDKRPILGGLMTMSWLNSIDMNYGPDGEILNKGIFAEFYNKIKGDSFDVQNATVVFNNLVAREKNLQVLLNVPSIKPVMAASGGPAVVGVRLAGGAEDKVVKARSVIDATQDADIAALAGVPYSVGHEDIGREAGNMAATLVFKLRNVSLLDWLKIRYYLYRDGSKSTGANMHSAWGFNGITSQYKPQSDRIMLRGLNIGRQKDDSVLVNALLIFGVDSLNHNSRLRARAAAEKELPSIVAFINQHVPGLGRAVLAGTAPELYVRESRHIYGEYRLTLDDVLENRDFNDRIAFGSYPVDMQPTGPAVPGVVIGRPLQYAIPFRCLVPQKVDGLLVVGRSASYDSLAHGSARTVPVGMAEGQAAGAAAALAGENNLSFRDLAGRRDLMLELQSRLNKQGMALQPFQVKNKLAGHWAYAGLKFMRGLGLAIGGYNNDYKLDSPIEEQRFINILSQAVKQTGAGVDSYPHLYTEPNVFNLYDACYMLSGYMGLKCTKEEAFLYFKDRGFFDREPKWKAYFDTNKPLSNGAAYMLVTNFVRDRRQESGDSSQE